MTVRIFLRLLHSCVSPHVNYSAGKRILFRAERNIPMRYINPLLWTAAADILSLFIALTLAGSANPLIRAVSAICTLSVLVCVIGTLGVKTAAADCKTGKYSPAAAVGMALSAASVPLISWLTLFLTAGSDFDFYRWYKLINGWGIQLCNFINPDASASALDIDEILLMIPVSAAPAIVFVFAYTIGRKNA